VVLRAFAQAGSAGGRDPDVVLVIHVDPVLVGRPVVGFIFAAPAADVFPIGRKLHHGWAGPAAYGFRVLGDLVARE
jgi:hypothetical protein